MLLSNIVIFYYLIRQFEGEMEEGKDEIVFEEEEGRDWLDGWQERCCGEPHREDERGKEVIRGQRPNAPIDS